MAGIRLGQKHSCQVKLLYLQQLYDHFAWSRAINGHVETWAAETWVLSHPKDTPSAMQFVGAVYTFHAHPSILVRIPVWVCCSLTLQIPRVVLNIIDFVKALRR